jgi:steroid 5-alpha reductase family enzyme
MSSSHKSEPWIDRWWPLLVIVFGLLFVTLLTQFHPTT